MRLHTVMKNGIFFSKTRPEGGMGEGEKKEKRSRAFYAVKRIQETKKALKKIMRGQEMGEGGDPHVLFPKSSVCGCPESTIRTS